MKYKDKVYNAFKGIDIAEPYELGYKTHKEYYDSIPIYNYTSPLYDELRQREEFKRNTAKIKARHKKHNIRVRACYAR